MPMYAETVKVTRPTTKTVPVPPPLGKHHDMVTALMHAFHSGEAITIPRLESSEWVALKSAMIYRGRKQGLTTRSRTSQAGHTLWYEKAMEESTHE